MPAFNEYVEHGGKRFPARVTATQIVIQWGSDGTQIARFKSEKVAMWSGVVGVREPRVEPGRAQRAYGDKSPFRKSGAPAELTDEHIATSSAGVAARLTAWFDNLRAARARNAEAQRHSDATNRRKAVCEMMKEALAYFALAGETLDQPRLVSTAAALRVVEATETEQWLDGAEPFGTVTVHRGSGAAPWTWRFGTPWTWRARTGLFLSNLREGETVTVGFWTGRMLLAAAPEGALVVDDFEIPPDLVQVLDAHLKKPEESTCET